MSTSRPGFPPKFLRDRRAREWIGGFLPLGVLLGALGSLLIAWQYHIDTDPQLIGLHFLALDAGYVAAAALARRAVRRVSIRIVALAACAIGCVSLIGLSIAVPPVSPLWRMLGLAFVGAAAGSLGTAILFALEPFFHEAPAAIANLSGALFGGGCLISTAMIGITYFAGSVRIETALLGLIPLIYFVVYAGNRFEPARAPIEPREEENRLRETLRSLRSIAVVLFTLLLFFQFGTEWAIAGWLPLFLIHRLGANPDWAIFALAAYFLALLLGRLLVRKLIPRVDHRRLLLGSIAAAMIGYLLLSFTTTMAVAWVAAILIGAAFAPIYPLVAEKLDDRFRYHPGFYHRIFSIAVTGAMLAPWLLGYVDPYLGIRAVMLLPALGSIIVLILALLLSFEAHLMGGGTNEPKAAMRAAAGSRD